ncbi:MAG: HAD-IA family hydrolase [Propionivibrio sp.]
MLRSLRRNGIRTFALTNFSAETYPLAVARFPFLKEFDGTVVSGEEGVVKPDPEIYERLLRRYSISAARAVFIDDRRENVEAARRLGFHGIHFVEPRAARAELQALKLPV